MERWSLHCSLPLCSIHFIYTLYTGYFGLLGWGDREDVHVLASRPCVSAHSTVATDVWTWMANCAGFPGPSLPTSCPFPIPRTVLFIIELRTSSRFVNCYVLICARPEKSQQKEHILYHLN